MKKEELDTIRNVAIRSSENLELTTATKDDLPYTKEVQITPVAVNSECDADADFENARKGISELISSGKEALDELHQIAVESQHPHAFEVYSKLLSNMIEANKNLLDIHLKMKTLKKKEESKEKKASPTTVTNNAVFVGTTAELDEKLKDFLSSSNTKKKEIVDEEDIF